MSQAKDEIILRITIKVRTDTAVQAKGDIPACSVCGRPQKWPLGWVFHKAIFHYATKWDGSTVNNVYGRLCWMGRRDNKQKRAARELLCEAGVRIRESENGLVWQTIYKTIDDPIA